MHCDSGEKINYKMTDEEKEPLIARVLSVLIKINHKKKIQYSRIKNYDNIIKMLCVSFLFMVIKVSHLPSCVPNQSHKRFHNRCNVALEGSCLVSSEAAH